MMYSQSISKRPRRLVAWPWRVGLSMLWIVLCSCQPASEHGRPAVASASAPMSFFPTFQGKRLYTGPYKTPKGTKGLTIAGYNYTDTYIDTFSVNGAGGGNLEVSTLQAGGGKGTCCAPIPEDLPLPMTVEVSWVRDDGMPTCKQTVLLDGPIPDEPNVFEVHFYPDGTIQTAITDYPSPPRLKLERFDYVQRRASGNVNNDYKFSECKHGR